MSEQKKKKVNVRDLKPTKDAKGGGGQAAAEAAARRTNSFTSARVAVFNPPRGLEEGSRLLWAIFRFSLKKDFRSRK